MIKIAFDVMGSDKGPKYAIRAAVNFLKKNNDTELHLVGQQEIIESELKLNKYKGTNIVIHNATEVIEMTDGILSIRRKTDASMVVALKLVKEKICDGMLTSGASAPYIAGCHFILGEFEGISKPGFMPVIPTEVKGKATALLDVGANLENSPEDLINFALMANIYMIEIMGNENPKIGLLNIGEEKSKGLPLQVETYKLLEARNDVNFIGNVEGYEIFTNKADIIVSDGYSGNIMLKTMEGAAKSVSRIISGHVKKNIFRKILAIPLIPAFKGAKKHLDVREYGGAILLGVDGIAFKAHGSSDEVGFAATITMVHQAISREVLSKMKAKLGK
ncbi:glycerol-3-phosphate acyltransferase PlsX [Spiroplasma sp. TIUS-1]|uniref:phosphate acyltransferase PlsX n=1 Tax=Spiroplasma sp. TIUS-1 TaxID=216963 RepID=UPI0013978EBA|nr:phosphate acyltransferase PlsX [Spiroplasma sp. TIUS-1]QHX35781.1 glycerol-3-phosphate acyltransferase PlsX [Spiroplasma sp. TIUS-1]